MPYMGRKRLRCCFPYRFKLLGQTAVRRDVRVKNHADALIFHPQVFVAEHKHLGTGIVPNCKPGI